MKRVALVLLVACTPHASPSPPAVDAAPAPPPPVVDAAPPPPAAEPDLTYDELVPIMFAERASAPTTCPPSLASDARIRCLFDERFKGDPKAASLAHGLWVKLHIPSGVEAAHTMDGGYRGAIEIRPNPPINADRKHLEWVVSAFYDFDQFFTELKHDVKYRFHPITLRFVRSVNTNTPAAYASDWTITYNVNGSINTSADAVRETMFHEIFHLNDAAWSPGALGEIFDFIVKKCGTNTACLTPYSPGDTMVRNGTYYSFQPGNGVGEYAAELALRYYREERAAIRKLPIKGKPFKCGPPENAQAWSRLRDELFGGVDVVPACP